MEEIIVNGQNITNLFNHIKLDMHKIASKKINHVRKVTKDCNARRYKENEEEFKKYYKDYHLEHKKEIARKHHIYYLEHKEKIALSHHIYYLEHKEEILDRTKKYQQKHKKKISKYNKKAYKKRMKLRRENEKN